MGCGRVRIINHIPADCGISDRSVKVLEIDVDGIILDLAILDGEAIGLGQNINAGRVGRTHKGRQIGITPVGIKMQADQGNVVNFLIRAGRGPEA